MHAPRTPAQPAKATAAPTLRPAPSLLPPARRPVIARPAPAAQSARAQPAPAPGPAGGRLAAVPAVLEPAVDALAHLARQQAPYRLLAKALGHDPLTGRPVPAAPQSLAHTLLGLLPDGEARYQQLQAAGPALAQLPAWLGQQLAAHQLSGARLAQVLAQTGATLKALGWRDLLDLPAALERLARPWLALARDVAGFVARSETALLRFLVRAMLGEAQAAPVLRALDQGGDLLARILRHPLPFLQNLVHAGWHGFQNFLKNGPRHLLASVQDWLLGGLAKAGLHLPARLDLAGVIDLLLQVFDLTKAAVLSRLRQRLAAVLGAANVGRVEELLAQVGGVALTLWQRGPAAAWQAISEQAGDLKAQALAFVQAQVLGVAARAVPVFLATLAVPGGAFVQVARGIYNGVMTFVEKGRQIAQVGSALLGSVSAIAAGQLAPAALAVENTLVKVLPVALSFLAKWLGLDGISGAIQNGLKKVQAPVEKAVNKVLDTVVDKAKAIWGAVKTGAGKAVEQGRQVATSLGSTVKSWLGLRTKFAVGPEQHTLFFDAKQPQSLMVASVTQSYSEFLLEVRASLSQLNKDQRDAYTVATTVAAQIGSTVANALASNTDVTAIVGPLVTRLAQLTVILMPASKKNNAPFFKIMHGGKTASDGFGTSAMLTFFGNPTIAGGTRANSDLRIQGKFAALAPRVQNTRAYYVLGHLLNANLGGTGDDMVNLTPLFNNDNGKHYREFEKDVLAQKQLATPNIASSYTILATYGRAVRQDIIDEANKTLHPQRAEIARMVRAEQYVPLNLVLRFRTWDVAKPSNFITEKDAVINNDIGQDLGSYKLK